MPTPPLSEELAQQAADAYKAHGLNKSVAALALGLPRNTFTKRLDAAVYQSVQVYGMSFLERGGVQIMLALIAISVFLAARMKPHREPLTPDGPHAGTRKAPQAKKTEDTIFF